MASNCYPIINPSSSVETDAKYYTGGKLNDNLKNLFKQKATKYGIDWKWLAALAWKESRWNSNIGNGYGYSFSGLFQYNSKSIGFADGRRLNVNNPEDQAEAAARDLKQNRQTGLKNGLSEEESYLYAAICHNAGVGGAKWAFENASPKNIRGMQNALLNCDGGYGFHGQKVRWLKKMSDKEARRQSQEKVEFPVGVKSAYIDISKKYS